MSRPILLILLIFLPVLSYADADNGKTLLVFFRSDCAPCLRELEILPEIAKKHGNLTIDIVSLDEEYRNYVPPAFPANVHKIVFGARESRIIKDAEGDRIAIPFSAFLKADGSVCGTHAGILGTDQVTKWSKKC